MGYYIFRCIPLRNRTSESFLCPSARIPQKYKHNFVDDIIGDFCEGFNFFPPPYIVNVSILFKLYVYFIIHSGMAGLMSGMSMMSVIEIAICILLFIAEKILASCS